jgi:hypothetical protein
MSNSKSHLVRVSYKKNAKKPLMIEETWFRTKVVARYPVPFDQIRIRTEQTFSGSGSWIWIQPKLKIPSIVRFCSKGTFLIEVTVFHFKLKSLWTMLVRGKIRLCQKLNTFIGLRSGSSWKFYRIQIPNTDQKSKTQFCVCFFTWKYYLYIWMFPVLLCLTSMFWIWIRIQEAKKGLKRKEKTYPKGRYCN